MTHNTFVGEVLRTPEQQPIDEIETYALSTTPVTVFTWTAEDHLLDVAGDIQLSTWYLQRRQSLGHCLLKAWDLMIDQNLVGA